MTSDLLAVMRRRELLAGGAAFLVAGRARSGQPRRIAAIDWAMLETAVALGVLPVAATELIQFRKDAVEPSIPDHVVDLGLRGAPNLELLQMLAPELILISPFYTRHQAAMERIAPTLSLPFYIKGEPPLAKATAAISALGSRLGRSAEAASALEAVDAELADRRAALARFSDRPFYLINIGDARHVRVFGSDSMFGDVLSRLQLKNAWPDRSRYTFAAPVPIENLADKEDARIVVISEIPVEARSGLRNSMIWNSLAPVKQGRVLMLGNINPYGGVIAGMRFARLLQDALIMSERNIR